MNINKAEYLDKVKGCWLGKTVGGTLGAPMEWHRKWNDVKFYLQDLQGNPVPNDDLDLQIISLFALEQQGADLDANRLSEYFLQFCAPYWAEYGAAKSNLRSGILPPYSGILNNPFKNSCGSFIRSELWACIAPGFPEIAVEYALNDAMIDHGDGEGVYAEVFCAAMQSAAFVVTDISQLIEIGLSYIPETCQCAQAVRMAQQLYSEKKSLKEARNQIIHSFYSGFHFLVGEEERADGLDKGTVGDEVPSNIGIVILALLYGQGDFEKSLCYAVNCGEDTDCTAGTIGALFGILLGAKGMPEKWISPIGENIVTMCISLGDFPLPKTVNDLTNRVYSVMRQVNYRKGLGIELTDNATEGRDGKEMLGINKTWRLYERLKGITHSLGLYDVCVVFPNGICAERGKPFEIRLEFYNKSNLTVNICASLEKNECIEFVSGTEARAYMNHYYRFLDDEGFRGRASISFLVNIKQEAPALMCLNCRISADGRANSFGIPIIFVCEG